MTLAYGLMIVGALVVVLGLTLVFKRSGTAKIIFGIVLTAAGLGCIGVGYTIDQRTEVTYMVAEITAVSARDTDNTYRVSLKGVGTTDTWVYVSDSQLILFPEGEQITMEKRQIKALRSEQ